MPDYREMYLHLMRETEKALRIIEAAQQKCEDIFVDSSEREGKILEIKSEKSTNT